MKSVNDRIHFLNGIVEFEAEPSDKYWLQEVSAPSFTFNCNQNDNPEADAKVRVTYDPQRYQQAKSAGIPVGKVNCFSLDTKLVSLPARRDETRLLLDDEKRNLIISVENNTIDIIGQKHSVHNRLTILRIIRELLIAVARRDHVSVQLHAAAFAWRNQVIVVSGPKGAGKSTALCRALAHGAQLLANDHVLLNFGTHNKRTDCQVHGVPTTVRLRSGTFELVKQLNCDSLNLNSRITLSESKSIPSKIAPHTHNGSTSLTATQLLKLLGATGTRSATLTKIIVLDPSCPGKIVQPETVQLEDCLYGHSYQHSEPTIFETLIKGVPRNNDNQQSITERLLPFISRQNEVNQELWNLLCLTD